MAPALCTRRAMSCHHQAHMQTFSVTHATCIRKLPRIRDCVRCMGRVSTPRRVRAQAPCTETASQPEEEAAADPFAEMNEYEDNMFGRAMTWYFTAKISEEVGEVPVGVLAWCCCTPTCPCISATTFDGRKYIIVLSVGLCNLNLMATNWQGVLQEYPPLRRGTMGLWR